MEYIDAADDDGNDVFVDIRDSIHVQYTCAFLAYLHSSMKG
jgi:hypothetical protein